MPINSFSNFGPNAFTHGVAINGVPVLPTHIGDIWWVDSGNANASNSGGNNGSTTQPFSSIDYAVGRCTANNGDIIFVAPGHTETVSAVGGLDLDVAGITIWFLGDGTSRGRINFTTAVGADMDVDAANVTLINARFTAGLDALTGPIDVNSANFRLFNATWEDGTTINTTDVLVADANADELLIDGFLFIDGDAAGTQKQSFVQVAAATRPTIRNVRCTGDFGTGIIENGTAWVDATLDNLTLDNASASPTVCVFLSATSTGFFSDSFLRVASGSTGYTAANTMQIAPTVVVTGTDGNVAADPTIGNLEDAAATGAVTTTDTLMSYVKQLVTDVITLANSTLPTPTANSLAAFIASGGTGLGTQLATSKSLVDAIGTNGTTVADTATGIAGMIGVNDADNAMDTSSVIANANGSVYERDEALQVAAAPSKSHPNYFTVTADMTSATWNTVAAHEIATVTGMVRMQIILEVTATVITTGTNGTIALGFAGNTSAIFSATALDAAVTGDVFSAVIGSAATTVVGGAEAQSSLTHAIFDVVALGGADVGYTIATNAATTGTLTFHVWWQPLDSTGAVAAGAGGVL